MSCCCGRQGFGARQRGTTCTVWRELILEINKTVIVASRWFLYYLTYIIVVWKQEDTNTRWCSTRKLYGVDVTAQFEGDIYWIKYNSSVSNVKTTPHNFLMEKSELFVRITTKLRTGRPVERCSICSNLQTGSVAHAVSFPVGTTSSFLGHKRAGTNSQPLIWKHCEIKGFYSCNDAHSAAFITLWKENPNFSFSVNYKIMC